MIFRETLNTAFDALLGNKLRTGLAILGIVIGIGAVVALITLGNGATAAVTSSIGALGSNLLTVSPGAASQGFIRGSAGSGTTLTLDDANAIIKSPTMTSVSAVSPETSKLHLENQIQTPVSLEASQHIFLFTIQLLRRAHFSPIATSPVFLKKPY
jgi:putative ABC transport system permease protein